MRISILLLFISFFNFGTSFSQSVYPDYQDGVLIFQFKTNVDVKALADENGLVSIDKISQLRQLEIKYGIQEVKQLFPRHKDPLLSRTFQVEFSNASKVLAFAETVSKSLGIEYAERKELHHTTLTPNDPNYGTATNAQWALFQINAELAWDISTGNSATIVAVTDNAINIAHPDLINKMLPGYDAVDSDNDPSPCGTNTGFHGSHVSGIVGAETNNNLGIASIGYDVSILPVKIGNCSGSLTAGYEGITWAADNGAHVINMSWGGSGSSAYGQNVCNYAWGQGAILIAAAGNDGVSSIFYPAGYNNVVSVASTTTGDAKSSFSNYGTWIDISAPGSSILSTNEGTGYQVTQGTSMASPMVAGLVGLIKSHAASATNTDIINCLYSSAANIDGANASYINQLGAGRIDAHQALICASTYALALDASIREITNPVGNICSGTYTPTVELRNYGSTTLTSVDITYQVSGSAAQIYNWTGNLTSAQAAVITLPSITSVDGAYTFTATSSNPNSGTDQNLTNDSQTSNYTIISSGDQVSLALTLDCFGSEISWSITDASSNIMAAGGPYGDVAGGQVQNELICLAPGCYTFAINDSYGDGMYGSQWGSCSVNGDYLLTDASSNVLVQMTAVNGDFGNGTTHSFCISSAVADDAGITQIVSPSGVYCSSNFIPEVVLQNFGNQVLTSATIEYQLGGGALQTFNWTGSLATNQSVNLVLPGMTGANGTATFTANTTLPNGNTDGNVGNDGSTSNVSIYNTALPLPFTEDFETNGFVNQNWTIGNPDNDFTWEIQPIVGTAPGSNAARLNFYDYAQQGQRDGMTTVPISFAGYTSVTMTFEHAYRRYNQTLTDSLIILVSTDCGQTYSRVFAGGEDGTGSFATAATTTTAFIPAATAEWCMGTVGASCFSVNLDVYAGSGSVLVKFESYNAGTTGNNLYVDNINITGVPATSCPIASATVTDASCFGVIDGSITASAAGGVAPLSYSIDGTTFGSSPNFSGLTAGTYTVYVRGADNCTDSTTSNITEPSEITFTNTVSDASCSSANGSITVSAVGGASGYLYSSDGGVTTQTSNVLSGLAAGSYQIMVTDANGCSSAAVAATVSSGSGPTATSSATNTTCSLANGSITLTASGGVTPYQYSSDGGSTYQSSNVFNSLLSGTYAISVLDANSCAFTSTASITNTGGNFTLGVSSDQTICEGNSATFAASGLPNGGTYNWDNALPSVASHTVSPIVTATYQVIGTDASGCSQTLTTTVNVTATPIVTVSATNDTICSGDSLTMVANGAQTYFWNTGETSSIYTVSPNNQTSYTVIGNNGSCSSAPVVQ
ncbi:MAG: hypothetical protein ACI9N1_001548, partial [Flavobacteriales bacterium]